MTPDASAYIAYHMRERGAAVDNVFARAVPGIVADSVGAALFWTAAVAAEEGRWDDYQRVIALGNATTDRLQAAGGDTLFVGTVRGTVRALEAYATWRRGDREAAYRELTAAQREATGWGPSDFMNRTIRWWIVRLALEMGRPEETERYLLSLDDDPYAHFELGRIYEGLGRTEEARERYELFVTAWRDADPELQPKVAEARQALARLGFRPRG